MDRGMLLDHLALAKRHVRESEQHVARQRELISELHRDGHDTQEARELLRVFEETLAMHIADKQRIEDQLNDAGPGGRSP